MSRIRAAALVALALAIGAGWEAIAGAPEVPVLAFRLDAGRAAP